MKLVINIVLVVLIAVLAWVLYGSIQEPIAFKAEYEKRQAAVVDRLMDIRKAQELHRDVTGLFANNFDTLEHNIRTGQLMTVSVFGDPDDPNNTAAIRYDTSYSPALDRASELEINLDSLRFVPFGDGETFSVKADTITYQKTLVNVVEVGTRIKSFMGPYGDPRFARYDDSYDPEQLLKFGNMSAPNLAGNWER